MGGFAWVTLATNDSYSLGALVLANSLRRVGTPHDLVVLITPGVTYVMREKLSAVFSLVQEVNILDSKDEANLRLLARPELGITFTKLHCWRLTQYEKCVFVDADTLVIRNCDELFEREELSAAPDVGWPDCFNSGVFVFKPSQETYDSLVAFATEKGSFDGGDQGLLNMYFSNWAQKDISKHLPFIYNMCSTATYSYLPAFKQFGDDVRIIHFIGATKPWLQCLDTLTGIVQPPPGLSHLQPLLQVWWNIFCDDVHPQLNPVMATSTLVQPWHNLLSFPFFSNERHSPYLNPNDETYNDIQLDGPDFSRFIDPWENYSPQLNSFSRDIKQVPQEQPEDIESEKSWFQKSEKLDFSYQHSSQTQEYQNYSDEPRQVWRNDDEIRDFHHIQKKDEYSSPKDENHHVEPEKWEEQQKPIEGEHEHYKVHQECQTHQNKQSKTIENSQEQYQNHQEYQLYQQVPQQNSSVIQNTSDKYQKIPVKGILKTSLVKDYSKQCKEYDSKETNERNDKPTKTYRLRSQHPSETHIVPKKVSSQSEKTKNHLGHKDAGLAGALAKLKLGEPRSNEQNAFEEHMRKQSWEHGQIDYLGRDSFENIWKKISQTLAKATVRESSPSQVQLKKDIKEESLKEEIDDVDKLNTTKKEEVTPGVETGGSTEQQVSSITTESVEAVLPGKVEPVTEKQKVAAEAEALLVEEVLEVKEKSFVLGKNEATATTLEEVPIVSELIPETPLIPELVPELPVVSEETLPMPILFDTPVIPEQVQETPILESPKVPELSQQTPVVSEVAAAALAPERDLKVQEKPVPIQAAESILQAEPKELVSQVTLPVGEEAISSIVSIVQESALAVSETLMDPETSKIEDPKLENGSVNPQTEIIPLSTMPSPPATYKSSTALLTRNPNTVSVIQQPAQVIAASEVQPKYETNNSVEAKEVKAPEFRKESKEANETKATQESNGSRPMDESKEVEQNEESKEVKLNKESKETKISEELNGDQEMSEPISQKRKSSVSISMEKPLVSVSEAKLTVRIPQQQPNEQIGSVETSKTEQNQSKSPSPESLSAKTTDEYPERPSRSKELKVPPTPTVIEATPPTSPLNEFKEETGGEPKAVKKLVKKVVKKQSTDDSEEATESESSGKKITKKVIKKVVKKTESPEADEGSTSTEKTKNVVKKTSMKPSQLETDKSVPETPPPECSEVPIPPKRKMKTSTTSKETMSKKPDTEL